MVARALYNKCHRLADLGRAEDALTAYGRVAIEFGDDSDGDVRHHAVASLFSSAHVRLSDGRQRAAELAVYDEVEEWCDDAAGVDMRSIAVASLSYKQRTLGAVRRYEERIAVRQEMIARFGDDAEEPRRFQVAHAAFSRAETLGEMGDLAAEVAEYEEWMATYGDVEGEMMQTLRATVLAFLMAKA